MVSQFHFSNIIQPKFFSTFNLMFLRRRCLKVWVLGIIIHKINDIQVELCQCNMNTFPLHNSIKILVVSRRGLMAFLYNKLIQLELVNHGQVFIKQHPHYSYFRQSHISRPSSHSYRQLFFSIDVFTTIPYLCFTFCNLDFTA